MGRRGRLQLCYADHGGTYEAAGGFAFLTLDLDSGEATRVDAAFDPHDIVFRKGDWSREVGANKVGPYYGEFDVASGKFISRREVNSELALLGHVAFSDDGQFLCATAARTIPN